MNQIRKAELSEAGLVSDILSEAVRWMTATGNSLWSESEVSVASVAPDVERGLYFLAFVDDVPMGTVRYQTSDFEFWPDATEDEAAYIHRLAVRRDYAGGKLSHQIMSWAVARAKEHGYKYLRLDTESSRLKLRGVYEKFGFKFHSNRQVGQYFVARYQLPLSSETQPAVTADV